MDNPRVPLALIAVLVAVFGIWKFSAGSGMGVSTELRPNGAFIVFQPAQTPDPYSFEPTIASENGEVILRAKADFPEGTLYRIAVNRARDEHKNPHVIPESGLFEPKYPAGELPELPTGVFFVEDRKVGVVKNSLIEGQIHFYPMAVQKFGCGECTLSPNLNVHLRVDRIAQQPAEIKWNSSDQTDFTFSKSIPFPVTE